MSRIGDAVHVPLPKTPMKEAVVALSAVEQLMAIIDEPDPYAHPADEVAALQLRAARERLDQRRGQLLILDQRVKEVGINSLETFDDMVPLLFSHTTYKSYPESFVKNGRWDRLLQWYDTVAVGSTDHVDLSSVNDIDSWTDALWAAGHRVHTSSGTSGKCSFIPSGEVDWINSGRIRLKHIHWATAMPEGRRFRWYQLSPKEGKNRAVDVWNALADSLALPGQRKYLSERPMLQADVSRAAVIRKAMMAGTVSPAELAGYEAESRVRAQETQAAIEQIARDIVERRAEPFAIAGLWPQQWSVMQAARQLGVPEGSFHPDTIIFGAGGTKGANIPPDYRDQIHRFYGEAHLSDNYGMTELTCGFPKCSAGRYHQPPWIKMLVLDQSGDRLLDTSSGLVEGRAAFFDIATEHRWGGVVSGDRVSVDYSVCGCGHPGPSVADTVVRYQELEGNDDKLSCAGTMEAYVRGVIDV
jgi:hypothetical protein